MGVKVEFPQEPGTRKEQTTGIPAGHGHLYPVVRTIPRSNLRRDSQKV